MGVASDVPIDYRAFPMDNQTVAPQPVNWEAVRMLASVVGVREAARRMELSEDRVRQRSCREGWLSTPEAKAANQIAQAQRSGITVRHQVSPAALIQGEIAALGSKTRLALARGIAKAGEHVETLDGAAIVADAGNVKSIAQTADMIHGWKDAAPAVKIRLDVLGSIQETPIVEIETTVSPSDVWVSDDVEDY